MGSFKLGPFGVPSFIPLGAQLGLPRKDRRPIAAHQLGFKTPTVMSHKTHAIEKPYKTPLRSEEMCQSTALVERTRWVLG